MTQISTLFSYLLELFVIETLQARFFSKSGNMWFQNEQTTNQWCLIAMPCGNISWYKDWLVASTFFQYHFYIDYGSKKLFLWILDSTWMAHYTLLVPASPQKGTITESFCLIGKTRLIFMITRMNELAPQIFMHI